MYGMLSTIIHKHNDGMAALTEQQWNPDKFDILRPLAPVNRTAHGNVDWVAERVMLIESSHLMLEHGLESLPDLLAELSYKGSTINQVYLYPIFTFQLWRAIISKN